MQQRAWAGTTTKRPGTDIRRTQAPFIGQFPPFIAKRGRQIFRPL